MRKFLKKIAIYAVVTAVVLVAVELALRSIPNDYAYKNGWLEAHVDEVEVLVLGSSHGLYGLRPELLDCPAFNAAHVAQTARFDAFVFEKFANKAKVLRWVVLPVSYFSLTSDLESDAEWWRVKSYCLYYGYPEHRCDPFYRTEVLGGLKFSGDMKNLAAYVLRGTTVRQCDTLGFGIDHRLEQRVKNWDDGEVRARLHTAEADSGIVAVNKRSIESIVRVCEAQGVRVLLLVTPARPSYREHLDPTQWGRVLSFCDSLTAVSSNVHWLNLMGDGRFCADDFYNSDHLNEYGADRLTRIVGEAIGRH